MSVKYSSNSHLLEYITLGGTFSHCCLMLFNGGAADLPIEVKLLFYAFVLANILILNHYRGLRIHFYPVLMGFSLYSVALLFEYLEEIAFYYYYLTCMVSIVLIYFFGTADFYKGF